MFYFNLIVYRVLIFTYIFVYFFQKGSIERVLGKNQQKTLGLDGVDAPPPSPLLWMPCRKGKGG